ncbi:hypothetical protein [Candidatus Sulfurimonas baltica]|uniref:Co-chaperone DjlA N-terminal domain-containing protein n=1 Tax=Candidatus Sulfurimonas baltica TaxID=2740404 RepID=A0A7S7RNG1_9BACT|nr:hypothetical protein [Candidatus Sulfurimonas baltica]QOY52496.1 hypothetical protein HUE88_02020 [Candidatus Sulfurimonas baltica]
MGFGKILGLAALGIGAVAAAPFTGGGSILGAVTLGASLAGAGVAAAGAAAVGATAGAILSRKEEKEKEEKETASNRKAEKYEKAIKEAIIEFQGDKEYFNYIIASTAIGMAVANADGHVSEAELAEIDEFVGGIASSSYPEHVKNAIRTLRDNPPSFAESYEYLKKVNPKNYNSIRDLILITMEVDGIHPKEEKFLLGFDAIVELDADNYVEEKDDISKKFLQEIQNNLAA